MDVAELKGREAVIEIVDASSTGWGHINIDQIVFSDFPPEPLLTRGTEAETVAKALPIPFETAAEATLPPDRGVVSARPPRRPSKPSPASGR